MKKIAVGNVGQEELEQVKAKVVTRAETRAQAQALFSHASDALKANRGVFEKNFVQTDGAETMAPTLVKAAHVEAFFAEGKHLTEAQRRFPELQKVSMENSANAAPVLTKRPPSTAPTGALPSRKMMSGGNP